MPLLPKGHNCNIPPRHPYADLLWLPHYSRITLVILVLCTKPFRERKDERETDEVFVTSGNLASHNATSDVTEPGVVQRLAADYELYN
jgi:hypothetical protein